MNKMINIHYRSVFAVLSIFLILFWLLKLGVSTNQQVFRLRPNPSSTQQTLSGDTHALFEERFSTGSPRPRILVCIGNYVPTSGVGCGSGGCGKKFSKDNFVVTLPLQLTALNESSSIYNLHVMIFSTVEIPEHYFHDVLFTYEVLLRSEGWRNGIMMPFEHRYMWAGYSTSYDLFAYFENDMKLTSKHIEKVLEYAELLKNTSMVVSFIRYETKQKRNGDKELFYDASGFEANEILSYNGEEYMVCRQGCYAAGTIIPRNILQFLLYNFKEFSLPHEFTDGRCSSPWYGETGANELLCPEFTGLFKVIPVKHLQDFSMHHMSNKFVERYFSLEEINKKFRSMNRVKYIEDMITEPKLPIYYSKLTRSGSKLKKCNSIVIEKYANQLGVSEEVRQQLNILYKRKRFQRAWCELRAGILILRLYKSVNANTIYLDLYSGIYFPILETIGNR